jgi:cytochrome c
MGLIKEPEGVDFIIQSPPLTDKERIEISEFIRTRKLQNKSEVTQAIPKKRTRQKVLKMPNV